MKANKLQTGWILLKSIGITAWASCDTLVKCWFSSPDTIRAKIDRLSRLWSSKLLGYVKLRYEVHNPYHVKLEPHKRYILMSNHTSLYDIPLLYMALPGSIRMLAKKELFRIPIWGHAMRAAEYISIDRNNKVRAIQGLKYAQEKMESGIILWIAPEGTRSRDGKLGPFKKGGFVLALKTNAIIIPIGIRGAAKVMPPKTFDICLNQRAQVHIGQPIDTTQYSQENTEELMKAVEKSIREALGS